MYYVAFPNDESAPAGAPNGCVSRERYERFGDANRAAMDACTRYRRTVRVVTPNLQTVAAYGCTDSGRAVSLL